MCNIDDYGFFSSASRLDVGHLLWHLRTFTVPAKILKKILQCLGNGFIKWKELVATLKDALAPIRIFLVPVILYMHVRNRVHSIIVAKYGRCHVRHIIGKIVQIWGSLFVHLVDSAESVDSYSRSDFDFAEQEDVHQRYDSFASKILELDDMFFYHSHATVMYRLPQSHFYNVFPKGIGSLQQ